MIMAAASDAEAGGQQIMMDCTADYRQQSAG